MDCGQWVAGFVRSGGFSQFCEAILTRGLFGDDQPEKMVDAQQACLVSDAGCLYVELVFALCLREVVSCVRVPLLASYVF